VFLGAKGKRIHVDTAVRSTGVVLERLDGVEVRSLTLGEAVLTVKLELSSYDRVFTPAVHVKGALSEHERAGIRDTRVRNARETKAGLGVFSGCVRGARGLVVPPFIRTRFFKVMGTSIIEKTKLGIDVRIIRGRDTIRSTEGVDGVGKGIYGISVVERLSPESTVEVLATLKR